MIKTGFYNYLNFNFKINLSASLQFKSVSSAFLKKNKMDLQDQLKNLFPDHIESEPEKVQEEDHVLFIQKEPMICKFEKRKGKATTIIEGYEGTDEDFKILAKEIKTRLSVGGTFKDDSIIIQGDYRDKIMQILKEKGFKVKRVGG
jgi:translation initiation factor 1